MKSSRRSDRDVHGIVSLTRTPREQAPASPVSLRSAGRRRGGEILPLCSQCDDLATGFPASAHLLNTGTAEHCRSSAGLLRERWSSRRSVPSSGHQAGSTPAPLRRFSGHLSLDSGDRRAGVFLRSHAMNPGSNPGALPGDWQPREDQSQWSRVGTTCPARFGDLLTAPAIFRSPTLISRVVVELERSFACSARDLGSNPGSGASALV